MSLNDVGRPTRCREYDGPNRPDMQPGYQFGEWTVVGPSNHLQKVRCRCSCGTERDVFRLSLRAGKSTSCYGPVHRRKHGFSGRKAIRSEYTTYTGILDRCYNPKNKGFKHYGGRGINVCARWRESFENFIADMGEKPDASLTLERKDVNGDYCPENCVWATYTEQANNRRNSKRVIYKGRETTIAILAREHGIRYDTLMNRLDHGLSLEDALTRPLCPGKGGRLKC